MEAISLELIRLNPFVRAEYFAVPQHFSVSFWLQSCVNDYTEEKGHKRKV